MTYPIIILAAGSGKRTGKNMNKVLIEIDSEPIIIKTIKFFDKEDSISSIYLVIKENEKLLFENLIRKYDFNKNITLINGGEERQDSVRNALIKIKDKNYKKVVIHDGARPFVPKECLKKMDKEMIGCEGVVLGIRVKDTIKEAENNIITKTLKRNKLFSIQTPQMFLYDILLKCHLRAYEDGIIGTDDASLLEAYNYKIGLIEGSVDNIKITYSEDFEYVKWKVKQKWE